MQSALDRRQELLDLLTLRGQDTVDNLACEFEVSRSTIKRDLCILSRYHPIDTCKGRGGGVRMLSRRRQTGNPLTSKQIEFLVRVKGSLSGDDKKMMSEIIRAIMDT